MPLTPEQTAAKTKITRVCDNMRNDAAIGYAAAGGGYFNPSRLLTKLRGELDSLMRPPSYDLASYKLAMPVNADGLYEGLSDTAYDMLNLPPVAAEFFTVTPNSVIFDVPIIGAVTKSVKRARCEMVGVGVEEFFVDESDSRYRAFAFRPSDVQRYDEAVISQYHCHDFPMVKIKAAFNGAGWDLRAFVKKSAEAGAPDTVYPIAQNIAFDSINHIVFEWIANPQELRIQVNNLPEVCVPMTYPVTDASGNRIKVTPTFGVYWQKDNVAGVVNRRIKLEVFK